MTHLLIVDPTCVEVARQLFTGMMVGTRDALDADLSGKNVTLWCHFADDAAVLCGAADSVRLIPCDEATPRTFAGNPRKAVAYAKAHVRPWKAIGGPPATPAAVNGHEAPVGSPVEPQRASATVTPITEARVRQQAKEAPAEDALPAKYSHDALAAAFTAGHPGWRYVAEWGRWLHWDGKVWQRDVTLEVLSLARGVCREQAAVARLDEATPTTLRAMLHANTIAAVERLARSDRAHARSSEDWDADPWILNTPTGIVDLRTGECRPSRADDHCTRMTRAAWDAGALCPIWMQFLVDATGSDADLMRFLQRMAGYCLTGSVRDHALFFVHGKGGNGKGTFLNTLTWVLGDYAGITNSSVFTETHNEGHPTSIAGLMGRRLVAAQEVDEGRRWAEARLKSLSGGDPLTARFIAKDEFTFYPQFKIVIVGNNKPTFRNVDEAIRRRLHLIPFTRKPAVINACLPEQLQAEAAGILRWAVAGCLDWLRGGLQPPEIVRAATSDYLQSQDTIGIWKEECCEDYGSESAFKGLWDSYQRWCETNHESALGRKRWSEAMESRGHPVTTRSGRSTIKGLRLADNGQPGCGHHGVD
jgi:P4 family phage/plasmid primase-like protien